MRNMNLLPETIMKTGLIRVRQLRLRSGFLLIILFSQYLSAAQEIPVAVKDSVTYGLQAGLSFTHFSGHGQYGYRPVGQNLVRFRGGGNVDIPLNNEISLRPELLLNWKGYKTHDSVVLKTQLMYVDIPVNILFTLFSIHHGPNRKSAFKLGTGLYGGYALHGKYQKDSTTSHIHFTEHQVPATVTDYGSYYKRFDAGINYFLEFSGVNFYSQIGASMGLVNIKPYMSNAPVSQALYKNTCINLTYGWRF